MRLAESAKRFANKHKEGLNTLMVSPTFLTDLVTGTPGTEHPYRTAWGIEKLDQVLSAGKKAVQAATVETEAGMPENIRAVTTLIFEAGPSEDRLAA